MSEPNYTRELDALRDLRAAVQRVEIWRQQPHIIKARAVVPAVHLAALEEYLKQLAALAVKAELR